MLREGYDAEFEAIIAEYQSDLKMTRQSKKPFNEIVKEIIGDDDYWEFYCRTDLSSQLFRKLKKVDYNKKDISKQTIVSFAVGYNLPLNVVEILLSAISSSLEPGDATDAAYIKVLTRYRNRTVEEVNKLLKKMGLKGLELLGTKTYK